MCNLCYYCYYLLLFLGMYVKCICELLLRRQLLCQHMEPETNFPMGTIKYIASYCITGRMCYPVHCCKTIRTLATSDLNTSILKEGEISQLRAFAQKDNKLASSCQSFVVVFLMSHKIELLGCQTVNSFVLEYSSFCHHMGVNISEKNDRIQ